MRYFLRNWLATAASVLVAAHVVRGIEYRGWAALAGAALVLGVLNAVLRPLLTLVALPLVVFSLGLFLLVINAFLLWLAGALVPGFDVSGFWSAVGGAIVIGFTFSLVRPEPRPLPRVHIPPPDAAGGGPVVDV